MCLDNSIATLKVEIAAITTGFKRKIDEVRSITKQVTNEIKKETDKIKKATSGLGMGSKETQGIEKVQSELEKAKLKLREYKKEQKELLSKGFKSGSEEWQKNNENLSEALRRVVELKRQMKSIEEGGGSNGISSFFEKVSGGINSGTIKFFTELKKMLGDIGSAAATTAKNGMSKLLKSVKDIAKNSFKKGFNTLKKQIKDLGKEALKNVPILGKFLDSQKSMNNGFSGGLKSILKYGLGIRSLYALVNKIRSGIVEGFKNLAQYSGETNASISQLMSSSSQLKNAMASAFSPLLQIVTPVLDGIIQKVIEAVNAFGQLTGALTGNVTYVRARKVNLDYAASLNQNASAASNAAQANRELRRSIMGFDQINKLDDNSNDSTGNNTGNSGYTAPNPEDMFTTESIPSKMTGIADAIKQAWESADFTNIGSILGDKLNGALNAIPWDTIKGTINKVASSLATFLNGFMQTTDFSLVGMTFAEKLNTVWGAVGTFSSKFDFSKLGSALASTLNGYFSKLDLKDIATAFSTTLIGAFNTGISFFKGVRWNELGAKITEGLSNIQWSEITSKFFELMGAALGGIGEFLGGLISEKVQSAKDYFDKAIEDAGGNIVLGIFNGILGAIADVGTWIYDNIFTPFIDGFKSVFGIHSPSTVMAEMGGYLISGLKSGAVEMFKVFISWVKLLPTRIKNGIGNIKEFIKEKGIDFIQGIKQGAIDKWNTAKEWFTTFKDKAKNAIGNVKDTIKEKGSNIIQGIKDGINGNWGTLSKLLNGMPTSIKNGIGDVLSTVKTKGSDIIDGIKSGVNWSWGTLSSFLSGLGGSIANALPDLWNTGYNWVQGLLNGARSVSIPRFGISTTQSIAQIRGKTFSITTPDVYVSQWVQPFASGGFPDAGQLFMANEAGPELVGKMGNKTTVANQQQIVEGIKAGVFEAMMDAFNASGAFDRSGSGEQVTEFTVKIDSETLYKKVKKGKERYERRFQTVEEF